MFMEPDIEILFQEYTCAKIMFDAFTRASRVCFKAYTLILVERFNEIVTKELEIY